MKLDEINDTYLTGDFKLKGEFASGDIDREEVLYRCERYAGWTLPNIFPDDPLEEYDELQHDYQSVGAQAVTNLTNKIMMALFQPSRPFYRMNLTQKQRAQITAGGQSNATIDANLAESERAGMKLFETMRSRVVLTEVIKHLIITGNALLYTPPGTDSKMHMYSLRDYTCKRDLRGNVVKLIIRETKSVSGLSEDLRTIAIEEGYGEDDDVSLYTCVRRTGEEKYVVWQELEDLCYCHKKIGLYDANELPWNPLTWDLARSKDYGTGLVENYAGDFHRLSTLAEAILDYTVIVTDVKNLVDPAGMTDVRALTQARSGAYVHGREEDLHVHTPDVNDATQFLDQQEDKVTRRIATAFLLNSAVTRDAERVTAEEIRMQAHELESSLGGVYSRLSVDLQLPLARKILRSLAPMFKDIEPIIVTGLDSLSRNSELDRMRAFFGDLVAISDVPPAVSQRVDYGALIASLGAGHGVDYEKFLLDEATVKANQKAAMEANAQNAGAEAGAVAKATGQS